MADTSQAAAWPKQMQLKRPLFPLGKVVATPGALSLFEALNTSPLEYLFRHVLGDWGELEAEDRQANEAALVHGTRVVSSYLSCLIGCAGPRSTPPPPPADCCASRRWISHRSWPTRGSSSSRWAHLPARGRPA